MNITNHAGASTAIKSAVSTSTVPCHTDEKSTVVTIVSGPPVLRVRDQSLDIGLQRIDYKGEKNVR